MIPVRQDVPVSDCLAAPLRDLAIRRAGVLALVFGTLVSSTTLRAQPQSDPEWPCVQVLVPEVNAAVVWPVPLKESIVGQWKDEPDASELAYRLGELDGPVEPHRDAIAEYAESGNAAQRTRRLNLLADGILEIANQRRSDYIRDIKRYTRQQIAMAEKIETSLNTLSRDDESLQDPTARADFEETLRWQERIYDQRERAIGSLCEQPVELEQALSEVLRDVAQYLP